MKRAALILSIAVIGCGSDPAGPAPEEPFHPEGAYVFPVLCINCPGLTNVEIDRSVIPHRARLAVGRSTSLRATTITGCGQPPGTVEIVRWTASDSALMSIEPTSSESATVTALAPGVVSVTADRRLPDGTLSRVRLRDGFAPQPPTLCSYLPALLFEVVP